jgi:protein O-mannosyl-transferase
MAKRRAGTAANARVAGARSRSAAAGGLRALGPRLVRPLTLALLAVAILAAFWPVLHNGWIGLDDPDYVAAQPRILGGLRLDNALWFLAHPHAANWHPLTSWSHMLDAQLFGASPGRHHAVSLLLHALTALLLVVVLSRMTGAWWRSVAVGALFALHPLRVESVAWISERKDVLSGVFFVLALGAYRRWVERPGRGRYAALMLVVALGLMSKPMLVTLPFVLLLLDLWPLGRMKLGRERAHGGTAGPTPAGLLIEKWPIFALAAASAVVTFLVQRRVGAVPTVGAVTPVRRLANAALSCWRYVDDTFRPHGLAPFYPYGPVTNRTAAVAAGVGLVVVTIVCVRLLRRRPYLATGWLWYLVMLAPVIGLVQVGSQARADRYTYLPTIGLLIALVWLAGDLASRRAVRVALAIALVAALGALSFATARQAALWKDTKTLFTYTLSVTRDNPVAHHCLGNALLDEGRPREAVVELNEALRLAPGNPDVRHGLGDALVATGRAEDALVQFRAALAVTDDAGTHHDLGAALDQLGRTDEAIVEYEAAIRRDPRLYVTLLMLAKDLVARGRMGEAEGYLRRALELDPARIDLRRLIAVTLVMDGRVEEAVREYQGLLRLSPDDVDALDGVAWIRATDPDAAHRDGAEAVRLAERACAKSAAPQARLYGTLAAAYAEAGRFPEAVRAGEQAVELARHAGESGAAASYAQQLAGYRERRPFHRGS